MIEGADHMYAGQEERVAQVTASWGRHAATSEHRKKRSSENGKGQLALVDEGV